MSMRWWARVTLVIAAVLLAISGGVAAQTPRVKIR